MGYIVPRLSSYKDNFIIKYSTNIDMPLNKETKPIFFIQIQYNWFG